MRLQQRFPETARSQGAGSSPGITGEDGTGMCRGSCKNPLMRQGQKGLPGRGIQKVFPAPLSSPLLPRSRSEQELCRALQAAFHPLWFLSSFVVSFILRPPELPTPALQGFPQVEMQQSKLPFGGEEGAPWPGLALPAPLLPPESPRGHPSLRQRQGKGGTRSLLQGTASLNPVFAHGSAAPRCPHTAPPELRA